MTGDDESPLIGTLPAYISICRVQKLSFPHCVEFPQNSTSIFKTKYSTLGEGGGNRDILNHVLKYLI